jgi:hypothetical protein
MNHNAIYALYPNVVTVDDTAGAMDKDGTKVEIDMNQVNAWVNPSAYKYQRQAEYPDFKDYLDGVVKGDHDTMNGTETWLDHIRSVKEAHPKEGE